MNKLVIFSILFILITSCSIEPAKIQYGKDACHYCKMNIVDKMHSAQYVTKKGKAFKYDAVECMLNDLKDKDQQKIALILVADYATPKELIDAKQALFLISNSIQSPMGANLSTFASKTDADRFVISETDSLFNWHEIQQKNLK